MIRVTRSVDINRPVADVFSFVADPHNQHAWQAGLHHVSYRADENGLGTLTEVRKLMGRQVAHTLEIVERVENSHIRHRGPATTHEGELERRISFEAISPAATRVTFELDYDSKGVLKSGTPVLERALQRNIQNDLEQLKDLLEAHPDLHDAIGQLTPHQGVGQPRPS